MPISLEVNAYTWSLDKKELRPVMRKIGRTVRRNSVIKMVTRSIKKKSGGKYPNVLTGAMRKSVKATVSKSSYTVGIRYTQTPNTDARGFYPAFIIYGVKGRIRARANPITDAAEERREEIVGAITAIIDDAFKLKQ